MSLSQVREADADLIEAAQLGLARFLWQMRTDPPKGLELRIADIRMACDTAMLMLLVQHKTALMEQQQQQSQSQSLPLQPQVASADAVGPLRPATIRQSSKALAILGADPNAQKAVAAAIEQQVGARVLSICARVRIPS